MSIQIAQAPPEGMQMVRDNLWITTDDVSIHGLDGGAAVEVLQPWPVYFASLPDLLEGQFLARAQPTSWHYIVVGDRALSLAELNSNPLRYASIRTGVEVNALMDVMGAVERLGLAANKDYELRVLRAPELYLLAVWLHAPDADLLLPVRPAPANLQPGAILNEGQLVEILRPLAESRRIPSDQ